MSNEYPKRLRMSMESKLEMLDAVNDSINYLKNQWNNPKYKRTVTIGNKSFTFSNYQQFMHRWVYYVKGSTQPRRLRRYHRQNDLWNESAKIAKETGSETRDVYDHFLYLMDDFVERG
jgi:hypothetical protein